jgi:hypothetical protein
VTRAKIKIYSDPADWQPILFSYVDPSQVPKLYGGTARDLSLEEALDAMNPPPDVIAKRPKKRSPSSVAKDPSKNQQDNGKKGSVVSAPKENWVINMFQCKPPTCSGGEDDFDYKVGFFSGSNSKEPEENKSNSAVEAMAMALMRNTHADAETQTDESMFDDDLEAEKLVSNKCACAVM